MLPICEVEKRDSVVQVENLELGRRPIDWGGGR
jgi:hypothetical protein